MAVTVEKTFIKTRVNVWTARRNKKTGRCRELAVSRGSTVFCLLHLLLLNFLVAIVVAVVLGTLRNHDDDGNGNVKKQWV